MKTRLVQKSYFFGTKISFLMLSFLIIIIAITVQHDIWPFLQENLPLTQRPQTFSIYMLLMGLIVPAIWLYKDWHLEAIRYALISMMVMFLLQILTEILVSNYFFASMLVPTALLYVSYRLFQVIYLQKIIFKTSYVTSQAMWLRTACTIVSFLFWGVVLFKLAFITFPQIIPDFS